MRKTLGLLYVAAILVEPLAANAASVTYDFTATVTSTYGTYATLATGTTITGTYTFDYSNAIASQSTGTVGSASYDAQAIGGQNDSLPVPSGYLFSSTASAGGFTYTTGAIGAYLSSSYIQGQGTSFEAGETQCPINFVCTSSNFSIGNPNGAYSSDGLPIFVVPGSGQVPYTGTFGSSSNGLETGSVTYALTSVTEVAPVPLPAAVWLMLSGLGVFRIFARKKCTV